MTKMPDSRPADYHFGYMEGCVFLDFDICGKDQIQLTRISFDGYGCCNLKNESVPLNTDDSRTFKDVIQNNIKDQKALETLIKKAISQNLDHLWLDALQEYHLI